MDGRKVSAAVLAEVLESLEGRLAQRDVVQVIDAFDAPHIVYDAIRKLFHRSTAPLSLFGDCKVRRQRRAQPLALSGN